MSSLKLILLVAIIALLVVHAIQHQQLLSAFDDVGEPLELAAHSPPAAYTPARVPVAAPPSRRPALDPSDFPNS